MLVVIVMLEVIRHVGGPPKFREHPREVAFPFLIVPVCYKITPSYLQRMQGPPVPSLGAYIFSKTKKVVQQHEPVRWRSK